MQSDTVIVLNGSYHVPSVNVRKCLLKDLQHAMCKHD